MSTTQLYATPICFLCRKASFFEIETTKLNRWKNDKELIQDVFPEFTEGDRELLISGTHPKCWSTMFPDED